MASLPLARPSGASVASLDDKYELASGRVFLTGVQALVRLLILQRQRDKLAGLNTGGFVSGYRGSPLGALDQSLWKAAKFLERADVKFQPGLNEDLAATSIWGTQQVTLHPGAKVDGVFAMWYGKGPGVDRCGDVFKHANLAGTSKHGGVLVLAGDDHAAKSSTLPHQSDHLFSAAMMPVLYPSSRAGDPRPRPARLGDVALLRLLGRLQVRRGHGGKLGLGDDRPDAREDHHPGRLSAAPRRRVDPLARRLPRNRSADAGLQDLRGAALLPASTSSTGSSSIRPRPRLGIITSRQELSGRAPGARRSRHRRGRRGARSASASTRSRCRGRWSRRACAISPRGSRKSWSSRRSARSSSTS